MFKLSQHYVIRPNTPIRESPAERPNPFTGRSPEEIKLLRAPFMQIQVSEMTQDYGDVTPETISLFNRTDAPDVIEEFLIDELEKVAGGIQDIGEMSPQTLKDKWFQVREISASRRWHTVLAQGMPDIQRLAPQLASAAQTIYDQWDQDEDGMDEELGGGGICQDIAEAMAGVLAFNGFECGIVDNNGMGEQHVWVYAKTPQGVASVDIPPWVYEKGSGYTWKKIPDIRFTSNHVAIWIEHNDPEMFEEMTQ